MYPRAIPSRLMLFMAAAALLAVPRALADDRQTPSEPPAGAAAAHPGSPGETGGHAADGSAAKKKDPNPFAGDFGNVIYTIGIFLLLLALLSKAAWKPLLEWQQKREQTIRDVLEKARLERIEAEKLLKQYMAQIDRAREEATAIIEEGKRDAETVRRRIQEEARAESSEMIARAKREIQLAKDSAVKEVHDYSVELAVQMASDLVRKQLRAEDHRTLVAESLERMRAATN